MLDTSWTTAHELEFIRTLGSHHEGNHRIPRHVWLEQYLVAIELRRRWGSINEERVRACVQEELQLCRNGSPVQS